VDNFVQEKYGMSPADVVARVNSNCPNIAYSDSNSSGGNARGGSRRGGPGGGPGNPGGPGGAGPRGPPGSD